MLSTIIAKRNALMAKFSKVNVNEIQDAELRGKAKKLKAKQGGFTLLELLVVVAILAAIAGTATISLSEAEKQTRSGLHASMMDGLTKALHTFPVLNNGQFPKYMDSMLNLDGTALAGVALTLNSVPSTVNSAQVVGGENSVMPLDATKFGALKLTAALKDGLAGTGLDQVMALDYNSDANCASIGAGTLGADLENGVRSINNLFRTSTAGGCGAVHTVLEDDFLVAYEGKLQPLMGVNAVDFDGASFTVDDAGAITAGFVGGPVVVALGLGPSASLFDPNAVGGMTATPNYRGGTKIQYNRFLGLFKIGTLISNTAAESSDVKFMGVISPDGTFVSEELVKYQG